MFCKVRTCCWEDDESSQCWMLECNNVSILEENAEINVGQGK